MGVSVAVGDGEFVAVGVGVSVGVPAVGVAGVPSGDDVRPSPGPVRDPQPARAAIPARLERRARRLIFPQSTLLAISLVASARSLLVYIFWIIISHSPWW